MGTLALEVFYLRIYRGNAQATGNKEKTFALQIGVAPVDIFCRIAKRTGKVRYTITLVQQTDLSAGMTNDLNDNGHKTLLLVVITDSKRNPLTILSASYYKELPRQGGSGNNRSLNLKLINNRCKLPLFNYFVHIWLSDLNSYPNFLRYLIISPNLS